MVRRTRSLAPAAATSIILLALALPRAAAASQIQMIRGHCDRSFVTRLPCLPPTEAAYSSPDSFAVWGDSSETYSEGCDPHGYALSGSGVVVAVFADSIYFRQDVGITAGNVLTADGRVDAKVYFRVPAGEEFKCVYSGELQTGDDGAAGCNGLASVALSRIDPWGATILQADSVTAVLRPGEFPRFEWNDIGFVGTLTTGEYLFEAHTRAQVVNGGTPVARLWIRFHQYPKPTAVAPTNWSAVKSLYR
jgi:hypothetical protein